MATSTRSRRINQTIERFVREDSRGSSPMRVDREKGVIYGVKVLGRVSPNSHGIDGVESTEYTPEAIHKACKLYEGINVNANHPDRDRPGVDRNANDRIGWLSNCRVEGGELFADLNLLLSDPLSLKLFEAAERRPQLFGLSHNALGRGEVRGGVYVITEIPEVRSVDVVADAGTVSSLFESKKPEQRKPMKLRQLFEAVAKTWAKPFPNKSKRITALLEEYGEEMPGMESPAADMGVADMPADEPAVEADPNAAIEAGLMAACQAVLADESMDTASKLKKLKELLTAKDKLTADPATDVAPEEASMPVEEQEEEKKPEDEEKKVEESAKYKELAGRLQILEAEKAKTDREKARLETEKAVRAELDKQDLKVAQDVFEALCEATPKARKALIEATKKGSNPAYGRPMSRSTLESQSQSKEIKDGKGLAKLLLN